MGNPGLAAQGAAKLGLEALQRKLGYGFRDANLLLRALTHRSASAKRSNQRLEYLGDAVLGYVTAAHLHHALADAPESDLTLGRAALINRSTLADIAGALSLSDHLAVGIGEMRSGGHRGAAVLADALEAVIGAVHEDGGIDAARALVVRLWGERLASPVAIAAKDAKSLLQEFVQARALPLPDYRLVARTGPGHEPHFEIRCEVGALGICASGRGRSRKEAEKRAAAAALAQAGAADAPG